MGKKSFKYDKILSRKFGAKILEIRKAKNCTQEEIAFMANISSSYFRKIERGECDTAISTAKRIARALGTKLNILFEKQ